MKTESPILFLPAITSLILVFLFSCTPPEVPSSEAPAPSRALETLASPSAIQNIGTVCPPENRTCQGDSMTLTAEMAVTIHSRASIDTADLTAQVGLTLAAIPSLTPPPWGTVIPIAGDLGWGSVYGKITDGASNLPIEGATVKCEHFSYTSPYLCNGVTTTNEDGVFAFLPVFFHDTDSITLRVEAPGYIPLKFEQKFFTQPKFQVDLGLFPEVDGTPTFTPWPMCTAPACFGGTLACGNPTGCPGGCGTVCRTATSTP
jgi:hypothetical protein